MKKILFLFLVSSILFSCGGPKLTNEFLQGEWQCFDAQIDGEKVTPENKQFLKETGLNTSFTFTDNSLRLVNPLMSFDFTYKLVVSADKNELIVTPLKQGFIKEATYTIIDFKENILVIQESNDYYTATTYLQRKNN